MKIRIRPDDPGMLREPDWRQMNDWLAELRDDDIAEPADAGSAEPYGTGRAEPADAGSAEPYGTGRAEPADAGSAEPYGTGRAERARGSDLWPEAPFAGPADRPVARAGRRPRVGDDDSLEITVGSIIGDQLRMPIMWCEMGSCISWHSDPAALGEADTRARAIGAGWRVDALGRLACPQCQQTDPDFRASCPVALWNREEAITMGARIGVAHSDRAASPRPFPPSPRD
jgi:hypothetical protein